jgi:hypothetical protein
MSEKQIHLVANVFFVLAGLAFILAVIYFAIPTHSLPSFIPGHVAHVAGHRTRHGIGALVLAALFFAVGVWAFRTPPAKSEA